jgi:hypothetical protein
VFVVNPPQHIKDKLSTDYVISLTEHISPAVADARFKVCMIV